MFYLVRSWLHAERQVCLSGTAVAPRRLGSSRAGQPRPRLPGARPPTASGLLTVAFRSIVWLRSVSAGLSQVAGKYVVSEELLRTGLPVD